MTCSNPECVDGRVPCPKLLSSPCSEGDCPPGALSTFRTCIIPCPECAKPERVACEHHEGEPVPRGFNCGNDCPPGAALDCTVPRVRGDGLSAFGVNKDGTVPAGDGGGDEEWFQDTFKGITWKNGEDGATATLTVPKLPKGHVEAQEVFIHYAAEKHAWLLAAVQKISDLQRDNAALTADLARATERITAIQDLVCDDWCDVGREAGGRGRADACEDCLLCVDVEGEKP